MTSSKRVLRIGTRESKLARLQTDMVVSALQARLPDAKFEIIAQSTSGDKVLNKPIAELGGTGVFVKELEEALLADQVDFVVHSLKDLPTTIPDGLILAATLLRDDPRDVFVSLDKASFRDMPAGSRIATSSRRRSAQLSAIRCDVVFVDVRGNVPTRLRKLEEGHCDGMVLAAAGLIRLGYADRISEFFEADDSVPAAGQGALGVECRSADKEVRDLLALINDAGVAAETGAERAFLNRLGGGCSVPIGALGRLTDDGNLTLHACVADGKRLAKGSVTGSPAEADKMGISLAEQLLAEGADKILETVLQRPQQPISPP
ncbi:MAG TPA: hydroxymethylbilane synthase [Candidatus Obscuribacterales bacterium]